jgi:hypothetical protein
MFDILNNNFINKLNYKNKMTEDENNKCFCCISKYNQSSRYKITCPFYINKKRCNFHACRSCVKKYIIESNCIAQCMNCKNRFSREFLIENLSRSWVDTKYKEYLTEILFKTEQIKSKDNIEEAIHYCKINKLLYQNIELHTKKHNLLNEIYMIDSMIYSNNKIINNIEDSMTLGSKKIIKKCINQFCNGFLNADYVCELCDTKICSECFVEKKENKTHVCDINNIKTVKLLLNDSKNCPSCNTCIHKIDGCDQMWCVKCKTSWDWKTERIIYGKIHNPHFYEYKKKINNGTITRNFDDSECNIIVPNVLQWNTICYDDKKLDKVNRKLFNYILPLIHNNYIKFSNVLQDRKYYLDNLYDDKFSRIKFLVGEINVLDFKKIITNKNSDIDRWTDAIHLYELFDIVCKESLNKIFYIKRDNLTHKKKEIDIINEELYRIKSTQTYINNELYKLSYIFKKSIYIFKDYISIEKILISSKEMLNFKLKN